MASKKTDNTCVSKNVHLMVVLCGTLAGGLLGFFFGTDLGKTILEQIFWGGLIGALVGNGITFIVNNA